MLVAVPVLALALANVVTNELVIARVKVCCGDAVVVRVFEDRVEG